jgi:L-iditol 2-dehydrogenase
MKAWVLRDVNDMRFEDVPAPTAKRGEALIRVKCASICSSDLTRVFSSGAYHYPIILGHEFSGIVEDCENAEWIAKKVSVFPLLPCFECESCKRGRYETCSHYSYIGSRRDGGFAEYVTAPIWNLRVSPPGVDYEEAALFEPAAVALHAVKMLNSENINSIAVVGGGVIGLLIARWLKIHSGKTATLIDRNSANEGPFDACFEAAGTVSAVEKSVEITKPNGQLILVGNPEENFKVERHIYWKILRKQLTVRGSWNSSAEVDWEDVVTNVERLRLTDVISHRYAFCDLDKAFYMIHEGEEKRCKVIVNL